MSSQLVSLGLWYFVPNLVTGWLQTIYYRVAYAAGDPIPPPGHPKYVRDRRNIFVLVIVAYLAYTIYEADWSLRRAGDFYRDLAIPLDADERKIQSQFRKLTIRYHPDKVTQPELRPAAEAFYIHLKQARDTLVDPVKRFAYDRFGSEMLEWRQCTTIYDYVVAGATRMAPLYIGSLIFLIGSGFLGFLEAGRYWRYVTVAAIIVLESYTITRPYHPPFLTNFVNPILSLTNIRTPYLPFQAIALAQRISISIFIAISQLAPLLKYPAAPTGAKGDAATHQQLDRLTVLANALDIETKRLLGLEISPFHRDERAETRAKDQLKAWLVRNEIRNERGVSEAIARAIQRRGNASTTVDSSTST